MDGSRWTAACLAALFVSAASAAPEPDADARGRAEKILEKAVAAHGGIEKIRASRSAILRGTISAVSPAGSRVALPFVLLVKGKKVRIEQGGDESVSVIAYDGKAFHYAINGKATPFPDTARKAFEMAVRAELLLQDREGAQIAYAGAKDVAGEAVETVEFRHADGERTLVGFHAQTGLLTYFAFSAPHPQKGTRSRFEQIRTGYREIAGIPTPARIRDRIDDVEVASTEVAEADYEAKIPDAVFGTSKPR
ncbi:MAG: hypothetical protein JXP34_16595 [Planctomycetes bacterium]|nr:hypothetical protein [Planctomycetota bacterium]